jgi:hypothetical protein
VCESLSEQTVLVFRLFQSLGNANVDERRLALVDFIASVGPRGLLTMLGFRKTAGS